MMKRAVLRLAEEDERQAYVLASPAILATLEMYEGCDKRAHSL